MNAPGAAQAPDEGQLHLNAPMGVLQTPLPTPSGSGSTTDQNQPLRVPQTPADDPLQAGPSASLNIDAEHGDRTGTNASTQKPAEKKRKPAKPAEPALSPLARLRNRFHLLTHPSKPAPKKEEPATTAHATHLVTGPRVPLPTPDAAVKVQTPAIHGLYASDNVEPQSPVASAAPTVPGQTSTQSRGDNSQASAAPVPTTKPGGSTDVEQWPHGVSSPPPQQRAATTQPADDFTAIPDEEYRATVTKIEGSSQPQPAGDWRTQSATTAPAPESQAQSAPPAPPPAPPAVGSTGPVIVPGEAGAWMPIPQAAPQADSLRPLAPAGAEAPTVSARPSGVEGVRDLAAGAPSTVSWSPSASQGAVIEPAFTLKPGRSSQIDASASPETSFSPGWSLPPAINQDAAPARRVSSGRSASSRYAQPAWMSWAKKSPSTHAAPNAASTSPVVIRRASSPPPTIAIRAADTAHGGS
jgi:hypothetical protein